MSCCCYFCFGSLCKAPTITLPTSKVGVLHRLTHRKCHLSLNYPIHQYVEILVRYCVTYVTKSPYVAGHKHNPNQTTEKEFLGLKGHCRAHRDAYLK